MADNRNCGRRRSFFEDAIDDVLFPTYAISSPQLLCSLSISMMASRVEPGWRALPHIGGDRQVYCRRCQCLSWLTQGGTPPPPPPPPLARQACWPLRQAQPYLYYLHKEPTLLSHINIEFQCHWWRMGRELGRLSTRVGERAQGLKNARFFLKIYSPNYKKKLFI